MRQSKYFIHTLKQAPTDEVAVNAKLLSRAGMIDKLMAGAYSYLPLGLRVLNKIKTIVRQEMQAVGGMEVLMPALHPKNLWDETGRWDEMKDIMYQFKGRGGAEFGLGTTHEEPIVDLVRKRIQSYKDLPIALYQIQDKFRNEPRAKSGLLRGREFSMKDLYSFHTTQEDLENYYQQVKQAYLKIFKRMGLDAMIVEASGGAFSKEYSHEFQVLTEYGEDDVFHCNACEFAQNKEIAKVKAGQDCPNCDQGEIQQSKAIEVGNIFKLGQKYSKDMNLTFTDEHGQQQHVYMGCYGLGPSRVMGSLVEIFYDDDGIIWPAEVSPFLVHIVRLHDDEKTLQLANELYDKLTGAEVEVLYDDRDESPGGKLTDADLIGMTVRLVVSKKNNGLIEYKLRQDDKVSKMTTDDVLSKIKQDFNV